MSKTLNIFFTGLLIASSLPNMAAAQSICDCSTTSTGTVTQVSGDVTTSGQTGFVAGQVGQQLGSGSELFVGQGGSATVSFGPSCTLQITQQSNALIISQAGSNAVCAEISTGGLTDASSAVGGGATGQVLLTIGLIGLGIWGIIELTDGDGVSG